MKHIKKKSKDFKSFKRIPICAIVFIMYIYNQIFTHLIIDLFYQFFYFIFLGNSAVEVIGDLISQNMINYFV